MRVSKLQRRRNWTIEEMLIKQRKELDAFLLQKKKLTDKK